MGQYSVPRGGFKYKEKKGVKYRYSKKRFSVDDDIIIFRGATDGNCYLFEKFIWLDDRKIYLCLYCFGLKITPESCNFSDKYMPEKRLGIADGDALKFLGLSGKRKLE